jgi:predicted nucleotidyltransferase
VKPDFSQYGFVHQENLIMACIGGSQAHGAKLGATDDTDWYGLYIPPPTKVLGLEREEHLFSRPAANLEAMGRKMWTSAYIP